jgi:hypothetical protein
VGIRHLFIFDDVRGQHVDYQYDNEYEGLDMERFRAHTLKL